MSTHVVELKIAVFKRVYVDDEHESMTEEQIIEKAKKMALEDESCLSDDPELSLEESDILGADYEYEL